VTGILGHLRQARAFDRASPEERRRLVRGKIERVARTALERSRRYAGERGAPLARMLAAASDDAFFSAFAELAPLRKADLIADFDQICTDPEVTLARVAALDAAHPNGDAVLRTRRGTYNIKKTSGTSGKIVYQVDTLASQRTIMTLLIERALVRTLTHVGGVAMLVPFPRRARLVIFVHRGNRSVYQSATSQGAPRWARAFLDAHIVEHDASLDEILARVERVKPELLFGLPSRIEWLARAQAAGKLRIEPRVVFIGGETFHESFAQACTRAWPHCAIINTYGMTETKAIATACPECRELHLCEDIVHLELLDERGAPCEPDREAARVFATSLWNFTVPILRYEIEDRIVLLADAGCRRRSRRIRVRGREPVFLWTRDRSRTWRPLDGRLLREALLGLRHVAGYDVVHDGPRSLRVTIVVEAGAAASAERDARACLERFVADHGCALDDVLDEVEVRVVDLDSWNRQGGKLQSIRSAVTPPELAP
jgi:phenylacetate-coenzyme A ligase PaaK-like adenylate-forming protein